MSDQHRKVVWRQNGIEDPRTSSLKDGGHAGARAVHLGTCEAAIACGKDGRCSAEKCAFSHGAKDTPICPPPLQCQRGKEMRR